MKRWLEVIKGWFRKKPVKAPTVQKKQKYTVCMSLVELLGLLPRYHRMLARTPKRVVRDNRIAYNMGPLITSENTFMHVKPRKQWTVNPSMVFVGFGNSGSIGAGWADFVFAIKKDPPPGLERHPGECYQYAFYFDFKQEGGVKKSNWFGGYMWLDDSGNFQIAKQKQVVENKVVRKHKKCGESRYIYIPSVQYKDTFLGWLEGRDSQFDAAACLNTWFRNAFNLWHERDDRWLTITRKGRQRVSFVVSEGQHKYFFKDRDKVVTTPSGQRKKIFHVVSEHLRKIHGKEVTIREHTRGIRHFFWKGFECHIFSPGWHGRDYFRQMPMAMYTFEDDEPISGEWVDAIGATEKLSRLVEGTGRDANGTWG